MSEDKQMTVGDIRSAIKDLPDNMPVVMDDGHECLEILSMEEKLLDVFDYDTSEETTEIKAFVFGVT